MKKIATSLFILLFSVLTANAQTRNTKAVVKKPVTKEKVQKALQSNKVKQAFTKVKENARKESE